MQDLGFADVNSVRFIDRTNVADDHATVSPFALDTTFVLFFLALDLGRAGWTSGLEVALTTVSVAAFIALPYYLPFAGERPGFAGWAAGRTVIAVIAFTMGMILSEAIGLLLPGWFGYLPMTFLIVSAIFSLYIQVYAILKVRLAR